VRTVIIVVTPSLIYFGLVLVYRHASGQLRTWGLLSGEEGSIKYNEIIKKNKSNNNPIL